MFKIRSGQPSNEIVMLRLWRLVCLAVLVIGCTSWRIENLDEVTGKATQEEIRKELGPPVEERSLTTGESVWHYRIERYSTVSRATLCSGYDLTFDPQRVLQRWDHVDC